MAIDIFATFAGPSTPKVLIGETTLDSRSRGIRILSISMGLENQTTIGASSGGAGTGKAMFAPVVITKSIDVTSLALALALASGAHYDTMTLDFFTVGAAQTKDGPIYSIACKMVFVSKIQQSIFQNDDDLIEEITMQYGAIQIKTRPQNKDGSLGKEVMTQWSRIRNNATFEV